MRKHLGGWSLAVAATFMACSSTGPQGPQGIDGPQGPQGPQGNPGTNGPLALSGVVPAAGLLDRELDVMVLGNGTTFDGMTTVDFGAGVTVSNVATISATALSAHLQIDKSAAVGPRDVTVQTAGTSLVAHMGFGVSGAIQAALSAGTTGQGGLVRVDVTNNDHTDLGVGFSSQMVGAIASLGGDGVGQTGTRASFSSFVDPLAPVGATGVEVANIALSLDGAVFFPETFLSAPGVATVTAQTPAALPTGTAPLTDAIGVAFGTNMYKTSTTASGLVTITYAPIPGASFNPRLNVYPTSGRSADFIGFDLQSLGGGMLAYPVTGPADTYSVVSDQAYGGGSAVDFGYTIAAAFTAADRVEMSSAATHGNVASAQAMCSQVGMPWATLCMLQGQMTMAGQRDVYLLPPNMNLMVRATAFFDAHIWIATVASDGQTLIANQQLSPTWPSHLSSTGFVASTATPIYLVVESREGGMMGTGLPVYTVALTP